MFNYQYVNKNIEISEISLNMFEKSWQEKN